MTVRASFVLLTYARDDRIAETLDTLRSLNGIDNCEVILVDNNEDDTDRSGLVQGFGSGRLVKPGKNLGVAGGRNAGARVAQGSILIFLDDDATLIEPSAIDIIEGQFAAGDRLGALAFRSLNAEHHDIDAEFPHSDKSLARDVERDTFRYIGVGHAIRRDLFERTGGYVETFVYGMEEFDLCFCLIKLGYTIRYVPQVIVIHRHSPEGRVAGADRWTMLLRNRLFIYWRHYPFLNALWASLAWMAYVEMKSGFTASLPGAIRGARKLTAGYERVPLDRKGVQYVRACGGTLWR